MSFIDGSGALSPMLVACVEHFFQSCPGSAHSPVGVVCFPDTNPQPRRWVLIQVLIRARPEEVKSMANRGVNKIILVGNLGIDPDIRYLPTGGMVTALRLATGEAWKDQDG